MAPKPKPKGKSLLKNKKVLYIGGGVLLLVFFLYYRAKKNASPATDTTANTGMVPLTTVTPQQAASSGTPSPNTPPGQSLDPSVADALGMGNNDYVTNTDLNSQISGLSSDLQAALAGVTFNQGYPTTSTAATPLATSTKAPAVAAKTAAKNSAVKYYTFAPGKAPKGQLANQAPAVKKGQTLHFAKGKGYFVS